jgi:hypothetical protein
MLCPLFESVGLEAGLRCDEASINFLQVGPVLIDLGCEPTVLLLELLVLVALFGVQVVQLALVGQVDLLDLLLRVCDLVLHVPLLRKHLVQMRPLLVVLVLDVHEQGLDVLGLGVRTILV